MAVNRSRSRGLSIWPFILIGVGVIWLLAQIGVFTGAHLSVLFRLWPVVLIAIGVGLLVGRDSRALSTLIGIATVVLLVVLMLVGPSLGLAANADVQTDSFTVPRDNVQSARIEVQANVGRLNVSPLTDSNTLFNADARYLGEIDLTTSDNGSQRQVSLKNNYDNSGFQWFTFVPFMQSDDLNWDVEVSDTVPLDLTVATGTGAANLNLASLQLTGLNVSTGTGAVTVSLPAQADSYNAILSTGTGSADIVIPDGAALNLRISSGTGGVEIDVPDDAAIRLTGSVGTGDIAVPSWLRRVSGEESSFIGDDGVWETQDFSSADQQIVIQFSGGTGGLNLR